MIGPAKSSSPSMSGSEGRLRPPIPATSTRAVRVLPSSSVSCQWPACSPGSASCQAAVATPLPKLIRGRTPNSSAQRSR